MSVTPTSSAGTVLKIGDGASPEVFTAITGVGDIDGPNRGGRDEHDATHHGSTMKEFVLGLRDGGEISFPLTYDSTDTQQLALEAALDDTTATNFQMILTDTGAAQLAFAAYVKDFKHKAPVNGVNMVDVVLRVSGTITES